MRAVLHERLDEEMSRRNDFIIIIIGSSGGSTNDRRYDGRKRHVADEGSDRCALAGLHHGLMQTIVAASVAVAYFSSVLSSRRDDFCWRWTACREYIAVARHDGLAVCLFACLSTCLD